MFTTFTFSSIIHCVLPFLLSSHPFFSFLHLLPLLYLSIFISVVFFYHSFSYSPTFKHLAVSTLFICHHSFILRSSSTPASGQCMCFSQKSGTFDTIICFKNHHKNPSKCPIYARLRAVPHMSTRGHQSLNKKITSLEYPGVQALFLKVILL